MDLQKAIAGNPVLKGTFIQELFETMAAEQFTDGSLDEVAEGEKVIGEMNDLEKALNVLRAKYEKTEREIVNYFYGETDEIHTPEEEAEMNRQLETCRTRFKIANRMIWENIRTRLAGVKENGGHGVGIRADFKIVQMFGDDCDCHPMKALFGLAILGRALR